MNGQCPHCTGIAKNPGHYDGDPVTPERMAKCVLYEAFTLAMAVQALRYNAWPADMQYSLPRGSWTPSEDIKIAALMKIRALYDFLYNPDSSDGIRLIDDFGQFGFQQHYPDPGFVGFQPAAMFTKRSIHKFIAHLTKQRITKPQCIAQPKFAAGDDAIEQNALLILGDVEQFISQLKNHPDFGDLDAFGRSFLLGFREARQRLTNPCT